MSKKLTGKALAKFEAKRDVWQDVLDGVREITAGKGKSYIVRVRCTTQLYSDPYSYSRNRGRWKARWDMLSERRNTIWGTWSGYAVSAKRREHKEKVEMIKSAPTCPNCGSPMKVVRPRPLDKWKAFWGCTQYSVTGCKGSARYVPPNS